MNQYDLENFLRLCEAIRQSFVIAILIIVAVAWYTILRGYVRKRLVKRVNDFMAGS